MADYAKHRAGVPIRIHFPSSIQIQIQEEKS